MFIQTKFSGYNRHGEQSSAGQFLILMQPAHDSSKYPPYAAECATCGKPRDEHHSVTVPECSTHGIIARLRRLTQVEKDAVDDRDSIWQEKFDPECPECIQREEAIKQAGCTVFRLKTNRHPLRAIVRYARLRQLGHFMMGSARVGSHRIGLSGAYGSDGLPKSVPDEVYEAGTPLPDELYQAWAHGGGHNSTGSEREAMAKWAKQTLMRGGSK